MLIAIMADTKNRRKNATIYYISSELSSNKWEEWLNGAFALLFLHVLNDENAKCRELTPEIQKK